MIGQLLHFGEIKFESLEEAQKLMKYCHKQKFVMVRFYLREFDGSYQAESGLRVDSFKEKSELYKKLNKYEFIDG